jgi:hypothetical protein
MRLSPSAPDWLVRQAGWMGGFGWISLIRPAGLAAEPLRVSEPHQPSFAANSQIGTPGVWPLRKR